MWPSKSTQGETNIAKTTAYEYYSDGSQKKITFPSGDYQKFFMDPVHFQTWKLTNGIAGSEIGTSTIQVSESTADKFGRVVQKPENPPVEGRLQFHLIAAQFFFGVFFRRFHCSSPLFECHNKKICEMGVFRRSSRKDRALPPTTARPR